MKIKIFILMFGILLFVNMISAVECDANLNNSNGYAAGSCTVSSSLTFNGTYNININGSASLGAIQINANNIILDCNRTVIYGNWSAINNLMIGVYINTKRNATIQNCNFSNYNYAIRNRLSNDSFIINTTFYNNRMGIYIDVNNTNMTYNNNLFNNNSYAGIWIQGFSSSFLNITNNIFYSYQDGVREENTNSQASNVNIINNTFYQNTTTDNLRPAIIQTGGSIWNINNNKVYGTKTAFKYGIDVRGANSIARNNYVYLAQYGLSCTDCNNFTMINNTIDFCDESLILNGKNIYVYNNTFKNMTNNVDGYNLGINIYNSSNVIVDRNNFSEIATAGINSQGSINVTITNNIIDLIPLSSRSLYLASDGNEPRCAIQFLIYYKGFIPTAIQTNGNTNVTVTGNIFDIDTPCLLRTENITNLNTDLTLYKAGISFIAPTLFSGLREWYLPTSWLNLSRYSPSQGIRIDMKSNLGSNSKYINYTMTSNWLYLANENSTTAMNITLSLNNNQVNFSNGTSLNNQNGIFNNILGSNEWVYIYNYNPIETPARTSCNNLLFYFVGYVSLIGLIGVVVFLGIIIMLLFGIISTEPFKNYGILFAVTTVLLLGVLVIVGIVIINAMCLIM